MGENHTLRDEAVLKYELACVASPHSELVQLLVRRESLKAPLNDERRDTLGTLLWLRLRVDDKC